MKKQVFCLLVVLVINSIFSLTVHVPGDYQTIQEGINVASTGDTVLVANGIYTGYHNVSLCWLGTEKHIIVKSENGPTNCIIDAGNNGWGFRFPSMYQDSTDVIEGFTIQNASSSAIYCENSSPSIIGNIIEYNSSDCGGGIYLYESNARVINNVIRFNTVTPSFWPSTAYGGGIHAAFGAPYIYFNYITDNTAYAAGMEISAQGGGISLYRSNAEITNNIITQNSNISNGYLGTGGIYSVTYSNDTYIPLIINNTISANIGRGIRIKKNATIRNNIIVYNSTAGIKISGTGYWGVISNNDVWGNDENYVDCPSGIGDISWGFNYNGTACDSCFNISEDPLFISGNEGDYFLAQFTAGQNLQSPCVDAGEGFPADYGLEEFTTRTDLSWDIDNTDIGYHYPGIVVVNVEENVSSNSSFIISNITNYPNPFNPSTKISFSVTQTSSFATIEICNLKGQKVKQLFSNQQSAGQHSIVWDGTDHSGKSVSSGVYFAKLKAGNQITTRKMLLLK